MTFNVYYKIENNSLVHVGLTGAKDTKKISFDSYESCILFEDKLLRLMHNNTKVNNKMIKELSKK